MLADIQLYFTVTRWML